MAVAAAAVANRHGSAGRMESSSRQSRVGAGGAVKVLECGVCEDVFTLQGDKVPRLLLCGHTVCHDCLTRLPLHGRAIRCPFDRQVTELGDSGVWGLKKNFALLELLERLQNGASGQSGASEESVGGYGEMSSATANKAFLTSFIEMYRENPCLWQIHNPEYCNKDIKKVAYEKLVALAQVYRPGRTCDISFVKTRIKSLRTVFKKEFEKIKESTQSGNRTDQLYRPKLWYYDLLKFTLDQQTPRAVMPRIQFSQPPLPSNEEPPTPDVNDPLQGSGSVSPANEDPHWENSQMEDSFEATETQATETPVQPASTRIPIRRREAPAPLPADMLAVAKVLLRERKEPYCALSMLVQERLTSMVPEQRRHVERIVHQALDDGCDGKLASASVVHTPMAQSSFSNCPRPTSFVPALRSPVGSHAIVPYHQHGYSQQSYGHMGHEAWANQNGNFGSGALYYQNR